MSTPLRWEGTKDYIASAELSRIVNVALLLARPLLIKGEPGTGKTLLARSIAEGLNMPLIPWNVKSTTRAKDGLYVYDTVQRLYDSRFQDKDVSDIKQYIHLGPLGRAFAAPSRVVLLIDEVDKADVEFPNDLLHELDAMNFHIPETEQTITAQTRPVVVITSNNEKELPDAFLRRCVFHFIEFPDRELMTSIVRVHFPKLEGELLKNALEAFYRVRAIDGMRKRPSTSELIDWIAALMAEGIEPAVLEKELPFMGVLLKKEQDLATALRMLAGRGLGAKALGRARMIFAKLFFGLRTAGLKVGLSEWMALMRALNDGAVEADLTDFYFIARALLVKNEALFDTYDQVFASVFGKGQLPRQAVEELMEWLAIAKEMEELTPEMIAELEKLPLDELRRRFEERLREQDERHDGGNRWIGTGGTSPFGNSGANPAGVRVGGSGGGRSAIQIATARKFREYRNDRVLDTRSTTVALKKLRRLSRKEGVLELDVDESIDKTCRNAGELTLEFRPPRENEARVLLLMDQGGSMDPYTKLVEQLFSAASSLDHWKRFDAYSFHNCVYAKLEPSARKFGDKTIETADLMQERPPETFLIIVGDAYMAPSELTERFGSVDYDVTNQTPGIMWLHRMKRRFPRAVWLNPIPPKSWYGWTIKLIGRMFPMFPLTIEGLDDAIDCLLRRVPEPLSELPELYPDLTIG